MRHVVHCIAAGALALALGCTHDPYLQQEHGEATRSNMEKMAANPAAGFQEPHEGLEPRSTEHVLENYSKGQQAQEHRRPSDRRTGVFVGDIESN